MKLRLPHKFQAALIAALASVSFTTLSTGTAAYAATSSLEDAELKLVDFTAETMTKVGSEGWTLDVNGTDFTGDASGIYTSTSNIARIDSDHNWAGVVNYGGNRTLWAGIITIDVNSLKNPAIAKASLLQDATGTSKSNRLEGVGFGTSGGKKYIDGAWQGDPLWGESNSMRIGTPLENYADANGLVTIAVIYVGDGSNSTRILVGDQTATGGGLRGGNNKPDLPIFLADAAGVKYSSVYLFGLESNSELSVATMQGMMKDAAAYHWNGSTNGNWDATTANWNHYGSTLAVAIGANGGNANTNVIFDAEPENKSVTLGQNTTIGTMAVNGDYTFNLGNHNLTVGGVLSGSGTLGLTGGGTMTLSSANTFSGSLNVTGTTVAMGNKSALGNANNTITIGQGGVIDIKGTDDVLYSYTLAGGTLQNTGANTNTGHQQTKGLTLTEDSTVGGTGNFYVLNSGYNATTVTLGGHKLTKTGGNTVGFYTVTFDAGSLEVQGGALAFTHSNKGDNTFNGNTTLTLNVDNSGSTDRASGTVKVNAALTLDAQKSASVSLNTSMQSAAASVTASAASGQDLTLSGVVSGEGSLTKTGTGTLTLSGANTYTGATSINAGTLVASSASALGNGSAVSVAAGALLDLNSALTVGSLTLSGSETEGVDGAILKFKAPSSLTVTGALTFASGSILDVANIEYSTGAVTLATAGSIGSIEGVTLRNIHGDYGATLGVVNGNTLVLNFGLPANLLVWDNEAGTGGWGSLEGIANNWHDVSDPTTHVVYPQGEAKDVRFTADVQATAILMENIAVNTLNIDSGATANVYTGGGSDIYELSIASVAGSGATLALSGVGTTTVTGETHLENLTVASGTVLLAASNITTLTNNGGTVTVDGTSTITTLNASAGTTTVTGTADTKATVGTLNITDAAATAEFTNANFNFSNGDRSIKGNVTIGSGATGTVTGGDSLNYDGTVTITVDGGTLVMNHRWTVGGNNTIVLNNGTVTGTGQSGASAFDPIGSNNFIVSTGTSSIEAPIRLRNGAVGFDVQSGTLTISGNIKQNGTNGLAKNGAGALVLNGTLDYNGNTVVNAGSLTTSSTFSIAAANSLQVKSGASATLNGTVNIAKGASFSVENGGTLTFGGTVAVTGDAEREWGPAAGTNGFGMVGNSATVGTGATGGTWTLNGHAATYNSTTGLVGWEDASTVYYIQAAGTQGSTIPTSGVSKVVVDTHDLATAVELGNGAYTAFPTLQIDSGLVTTTHSDGTGVISGDIIVNGGGTFKVSGEHDAFGYNGGQTDNIILNGAAGALATLELHQTTNNSATMQTNLVLNGHARITDTGDHHKGFNTYGGSITATGTDNVIDHMSLRKPVTVTVNSGADLVVTTLDNDINDDTRDLTKQGAGSLTLSNSSATIRNLNLNGGTLTFAGGTTTVTGTLLNDNVNVSSVLVVGADADHTAVLKVNRLENGNVNNGDVHSDVVINTGSTLQITGDNTAVNYKQASRVLGEWNVAPSTVDVMGTLLADKTHILAGDHGYTMNIDGGTVIAKGLKTNGGNYQHKINISNDGKLILGDVGITSADAHNNVTLTVNNGTIGVYGGGLTMVSIDKDIALSGEVTFDTQFYTVNGTAVERGTDGGSLTISGALTGNAAITKAGQGTLMLDGNNTITHTINLEEGFLVLQGTTTVDAANLMNFVQVEGSTAKYTKEENGFIISYADYYLVKGATGSEVDASTLNLTGGTILSEKCTSTDVVFTFGDPEVPGGLYYVNTDMSHDDDASDMDAATGFVIKEGSTFTIPTGTTVSNKVIYGAGTYSITSNSTAPLGTDVTLDADWTGIVSLTGSSSDSFAAIYSNLANENSWVEFTGYTGYDNSWASSSDSRFRSLTQNIILENKGDAPAWTFTAAASGLNYMYATGVWKGHGTFKMSGGNKQGVQFSNNISGWEGILEASNSEKHVRFTENANVVNAEIKRTGGTLAVEVETDVQFNKAITANTITVADGKTATLNADNTWSGTTVSGQGSLAVAAEKTLTLNSSTGGNFILNNGSSILANIAGQGDDHNRTFDSLVVNGTATLNSTTVWNPVYNIGNLSGKSGSLLKLSANATVDHVSIYNLNSGDFKGNIEIKQQSGGIRYLAMNINAGAATMLQDSVVTLDGTGDADHHTGIGLGTDATVRGIVSNDTGVTPKDEHVVFSGAAQYNGTKRVFGNNSSTVRTLTIATQEHDNFSTRAKVQNNVNLVKTGAGTQALSAETTAEGKQFNGSIDVEAGELNVMNIAAQTSLNAKDVTIAAGATLGVYNGATATADTEHEGTLTMKSGSHLKAGGDNATLNANLVMESGSTLEVSLAQATYGLTMGCSLSLNTGDLLGTEDLGFVQDLKFGDYYYLSNGVDSLTVNSTQYEAMNFQDYKHFDMDASKVYTQLDENRYALVYSWNGENVGRVAITLLPEPTTGTLSLLALAALAARRRRK